MGEPALREASPLAPSPTEPASEATAIVSMLERAARDPAVDVDKIMRLYELHEKATARAAEAAYADTLAAMQPLLPVVSERGGIKNNSGAITSTYALWEDINAAILPVLSHHGFALSFRTGRSPEGQITVTGVLTHRLGHREETTLTLPVDSSGSKNSVQAVGSSTSYGKRYTAAALLNLTTKGEDDDGQAAGAKSLGDGAQRQVEKINACETADQLAAWHRDNREAVTKLPKAEGARVVQLWRERTTKLTNRT